MERDHAITIPNRIVSRTVLLPQGGPEQEDFRLGYRLKSADKDRLAFVSMQYRA
jgi:hypothetical protein